MSIKVNYIKLDNYIKKINEIKGNYDNEVINRPEFCCSGKTANKFITSMDILEKIEKELSSTIGETANRLQEVYNSYKEIDDSTADKL